jgi:hypothetical protein
MGCPAIGDFAQWLEIRGGPGASGKGSCVVSGRLSRARYQPMERECVSRVVYHIVI